MTDPLVETWRIHDRILVYLLNAVPTESLPAKGGTGGRSIGAMFAHIHNVRLMWLKATGAPALPTLAKFEADAAPSAAELRGALEASGTAIAGLVEHGLANGGRVKGFKPHVHAFVGYLISHESHHRGQIALALKAAGTPLEKKTAYGLWEWGVR